jgi:hypothetical protein
MQTLLEFGVDGGPSTSKEHHLFLLAWLRGRDVRDRRIGNQTANLAESGWHESSAIGSQSPAKYAPRLRDKLEIDDDAWARLCADHALPPGWESMECADFLSDRRPRIADTVRVTYRKLGGQAEAEALAPPRSLPASAAVWQRIAETEQALRAVIPAVYVASFKEDAARRIEQALPEQERASSVRALRARPVTPEPLTVIDYSYLAQLPSLLFTNAVWESAHDQLGGSSAMKQGLRAAIGPADPATASSSSPQPAGARHSRSARLRRSRPPTSCVASCSDCPGGLRLPHQIYGTWLLASATGDSERLLVRSVSKAVYWRVGRGLLRIEDQQRRESERAIYTLSLGCLRTPWTARCRENSIDHDPAEEWTTRQATALPIGDEPQTETRPRDKDRNTNPMHRTRTTRHATRRSRHETGQLVHRWIFCLLSRHCWLFGIACRRRRTLPSGPIRDDRCLAWL